MDKVAQMQRRQAVDHVLGKNRGIIAWISTGFVGALALMFMAYEQGTVPKGSDARLLFERIFDADADGNDSFDAAGVKAHRNNLKLSGEVRCRIHVDRGRRDQAYDYDCIAPIADASRCTRYFAFYSETSSIGPITRPLSDEVALDTMRDFGLLTGKACLGS